MQYKLDIKNKKILEELDANARQSNARIAKKAHISKDAVGYRIAKMEREGIISGYYSVLNIAKLGYTPYKLMITFQNTNSEIEREIIRYLERIGGAGWVVSCEGYYNLMAILWLEDENAFDAFFTQFLEKYSDYIKERDMLVITEIHSCRKTYLYGSHERGPDIYYGGEEKEALDGIDLKIVRALANNSRMRLEEIAESLGISGEAVAYRIRQLEKKNLLQAFRAKINASLLGYSYYNVLFRLKKFGNIKKIFAFFRRQPNIIYFVKYLGSCDIGIDLEVKSPAELREVISGIKDAFSQDIESYNPILIYREHKLTYMPE